ncbi:MAG: phosphoribosylaminoimidazolesuccinocarboxamide synthase [Gemmatimonadota bacterium]|nr:phosphoribosylaminoimidazolesuccinocarboxamide synthase [Gemmatimonadota bacterium]
MSAPLAGLVPLPLWRRGKVRDVFEVDRERLLLVASDRVSAFDVVMNETVPDKGRVLTQLSAFWFQTLAPLGPSHFLTADDAAILAELPVLAPVAAELAGRSMLVRRTEPVAFECVVRGYLAGSAWGEYHQSGTLAGESLPAGLQQSSRFAEPIFSPATKAEHGHDENVTIDIMAAALGAARTEELRTRSLAIYEAGQAHAAARGILVADTKFEFGVAPDGTLLLIDEVLTPDSSRFWPGAGYQTGRTQPSFDKQPLRDFLAGLRDCGQWNGEAPPPPLPAEVISATTVRYREAFHRLTGTELSP